MGNLVEAYESTAWPVEPRHGDIIAFLTEQDERHGEEIRNATDSGYEAGIAHAEKHYKPDYAEARAKIIAVLLDEWDGEGIKIGDRLADRILSALGIKGE